MIRAFLLVALAGTIADAQIAVRGETVYTMAGEPLRDGVVLIRDGKIERAGAGLTIPAGYRTIRAKVVTPGLIDAHTVLGLSGYLNQPHDQDQIERSAAMQPDLRAIDAYNPRERLIEFVRSFGVTTIHTGHAPGALISGQTMIVKTAGNSVEEALVRPEAMVACSFGEEGLDRQPNKSPGTRGKLVAMLRTELIKAQEYDRNRAKAEHGKEPARDLKLDVLARVAKGEMPLLVTVHRAHDILTVLRVGKEFGLKIVLDGASEAYLVMDQIKAAGYPVILHPTMYRSGGDAANLSMETASRLKTAGIPFALQSGFESYVPKTRVVLFEAAVAAANGLSFEQALAAVTIDAAKLLGIDQRAGSIEAGKDADLALYDGDPFEYASHCIGVILNGAIVSESRQ
jgi:imidazolonepropionase-like amidohydrolase